MPAATDVKEFARAIGFDAVGICDLRPIERRALPEWLTAGYAGEMAYMHRQAPKRAEPARIVPGARRAIVVLKNYFQAASGLATKARVARYAWGEDYHRVLSDQLATVADRLVELGANREATRSYSDAGPVPERELAQRAGLGWIARNTMLIHPRIGSFTFIGTVFTDLELDVDEPFETDRCGSCRACLDACPTNAFPRDRTLDATRCISYLTIELRGSFTLEQGGAIGTWLFGCDICQDVCPWNEKFSSPTKEPRFVGRPELMYPDVDRLTAIEEASFRATYAETAFERAGPPGIARNARAVRHNSSSE